MINRSHSINKIKSPLLRGDLGVCLILLVILAYIPQLIHAQDNSVNATLIYDDLRKATSVYANSNFLYVVESGQHRVLKFDHSGTLVESVGGLGFGSYQLDTPVDIDATNGLKIFVSDLRNNRVQVFDRRFQYLSTVRLRRTPGYEREIQPSQIAVNNFGELIVFDEQASLFYKFTDKGEFISNYRIPAKVKSVTDLQSDGRFLYVFDAKGKQYHLMYDNGLRVNSFPAKDAKSVFIDEKGVEWAFTLNHMYNLKNPDQKWYWDYEIEIKDVTGFGSTYFLMTPTSIYKVELPQK